MESSNIYNFIINFFTPREWATITLLGLLILFFAKSKEGRSSILRVINAFFQQKILLTILCAQIYLMLIIFALSKFGLWNNSYLRETLFFLFYTSISLIFKYISNECVVSVKGIVEDTIKATLIIEFYLNIYTFSYLGELFLQFLLSLFYLMGVWNKRDTKETETVYVCTQILFYSLTSFLIGYSIYKIFQQWQDIFLIENIVSLLFPIIATIAYWPFLYLLSVYAAYESWFVRVFFASNKNKETYRFRKQRIIQTCRLNLRKIIFVSKDLHIFIPQTQEQFVEDLHVSAKKYKEQSL